MTRFFSRMPLVLLALVACVGCGSASEAPANADGGDGPANDSAAPPDETGKPADDAGTDAPAAPPPKLGETVAHVMFDARTVATPVTFGHVFVAGDVPKTASVVLRTATGVVLPTQVERKANAPDGSLRHALLSTILPVGAAGSFDVVLTDAVPATGTPRALKSLLDDGFDAVVTARLGGRTYIASAKSMLSGEPRSVTRWLDGAIVTEWDVSGALADTTGAHPHLHVRFAVRSYLGVPGERVDVTLENDWAFVTGPANFTYDLVLAVRGKSVFAKSGVVHRAHTRIRRVVTPFVDPSPHLERAYLDRTGAVPHYDPSVVVAEHALAEWGKAADAATDLAAVVLVEKAMETTGGRPDLGVLPAWSAAYVMTGDPRARRAVLAVGDTAGQFSTHYRDEKTGDIVSIVTYPDVTLLGDPGDTTHPFPACTDCASPLSADSAHQPSMSYLPYLLTGDRFHLEELELWANYNVMQANPEYRGRALGLVKFDQVRGMAWSMRTFGQVAFLAPDADPQKAYFTKLLRDNLAWFVDHQVNGEGKNALGLVTFGYAFSYDDETGIAPWQDDFFTSAIHQVASMGFTEANTLLAFKGTAPVQRMMDGCFIDAATYALVVRSSKSGAVFPTYEAARVATFATSILGDGTKYLDQPCGSKQMADFLTRQDIEHGTGRSPWAVGEMTGYAASDEGYPSNMQPALAAAVDAKIDRAAAAWAVFAARSVKPTYAEEPQFAIVPR